MYEVISKSMCIGKKKYVYINLHDQLQTNARRYIQGEYEDLDPPVGYRRP